MQTKEEALITALDERSRKNFYRLRRALNRAFLTIKEPAKNQDTANQMKSVAKRIFNHAYALGWVEFDPTQRGFE